VNYVINERTIFFVEQQDPWTKRKRSLKLIANKFFENIENLKYFGTIERYKNWFHVEIKSRLNSRIVCYYSVQNTGIFVFPYPV
jgi:hypothetical protein